MKKILILDDDKLRHLAFNRNLIGHDTHSVYTAKEAIQALQTNKYDIVFLDHDLGGEVMVDSFSYTPTGYVVAKWLEENPSYKPANIYIHSFNPVGAENMHKCLPDAKLVPGIWCNTSTLRGIISE